MKCPYCREDNDKVVDTRSSDDGYSIRRRRHCQSCDRRYTTYERAAEFDLKVVKKRGEREPFQPEKVREGLQRACWKRPVSDANILAVVAQVEQEVFANYDTEVPSQELGLIVMKHLANLDQVAFVRFASVYRDFKDVREFVDELRELGRPPDRQGDP